MRRPGSDGVEQEVFVSLADATLGDLQQVVEYHFRQAKTIMASGRKMNIESLAEHIVTANLATIFSNRFLGNDPEADLPFPV